MTRLKQNDKTLCHFKVRRFLRTRVFKLGPSSLLNATVELLPSYILKWINCPGLFTHNMMRYSLIFFLLCANSLASPVAQVGDDQQLDELSENLNPDDFLTFADSDSASASVRPSCLGLSEIKENPEGSGGGENILRREPGAQCSTGLPINRPMTVQDEDDSKYKVLPSYIPPGPLRKEAIRKLDQTCEHENHRILLYCAGPEVDEFAYHDYNPPMFIIPLVINCVKGKQAFEPVEYGFFSHGNKQH